MNDKHVFVDTNILVYAHDRDAGTRHARAVDIIENFWRRPLFPAISVQVLQELYVTLERRAIHPREIRHLIEDYSRWRVVQNTAAVLLSGMEIKEQCRLSLWDSLIIAAARESGSTILLSEDLSHGRDYGGVTVRNPFA